MTALPTMFFLGRIRELGELSSRWLEEAERAGNVQAQTTLRSMRAFGHLQRDDVRRAKQDMERVRASALDIDISTFGDLWWPAWVHLYAGEPDHALKVCGIHRQRWQSVSWTVTAHRVSYWFAVASACATLIGDGQGDRMLGAGLHRRPQAAVPMPGT